MMITYKLKFFYPNFFNNRGISYVCLSLAKNMKSEIFETSVMGIASTKEARLPFYKDAIPAVFKSIAYRLFSNELLKRFAEYRFKRNAKKGDIVYLWPGSSSDLFKSLKNKGCLVVRENINTHTAFAKNILDKEYQLAGMKDDFIITNESVQKELEYQNYSDIVFSPSPMVTQSLLEKKVPMDSIIEASYGLGYSDILDNVSIRKYKNDDYITAIFVGRICIRKGVHILIDVWSKANINGKLILVGAIDNNIKDFIEKNLSESITHINYTDDLKSLYSSANIFMLPSIEEGSPLVSYLALGAALPSLVSPMGSGGVITDNEGFILDPHDQEAWIIALKTLAKDSELRKKMSENAYETAKEYTWEKVGIKRVNSLYTKLQESNFIN